ncbi:MAG: alkaline phosphatase family protein [Gallionella sp.]|nr:alkaline phosphatase family protein [Gallionella sp.]
MKILALLFTLLSSAACAENLPRPDHIVVVVMENRGYAQIMDKLNQGSYIHSLAQRGALFTRSYGITHPSQPNYLALFSGSTQGVTSNVCPLSFSGDTLASRLIDAGLSFTSYAESLPQAGDPICVSGAYQRKHNPIANWPALPAAMNQPFSSFPANYAALPTVAFVIPDQLHDMHDGSFYMADDWLRKHIAPYLDWAEKNNSLLILTWDEDNYLGGNRIVTILAGAMIKKQKSAQAIDHYTVLHTLLEMYNLAPLGATAQAQKISGIWQSRQVKR